MALSLDLHIFTNSTPSSPSTQMIMETYQSFCDRFGFAAAPTVWCDRNPNVDQAEQYLSNLRQQFDRVVESRSLSDGYSRAVQSSTADWLFMLEHDWEFLPTITHDIATIVDVMREQNLLHLRFNKRSNMAKKSDRNLQAIAHARMPYCTTGFLSNNPHVINRARYLTEALPFINVREKTFGIEKDLSAAGLKGAIYGPADYPATITHKDGKTFQAKT